MFRWICSGFYTCIQLVFHKHSILFPLPQPWWRYTRSSDNLALHLPPHNTTKWQCHAVEVNSDTILPNEKWLTEHPYMCDTVGQSEITIITVQAWNGWRRLQLLTTDKSYVHIVCVETIFPCFLVTVLHDLPPAKQQPYREHVNGIFPQCL